MKGPCTASDKPGKHIVSGFWLAPVAFDLVCTFLTLWKVKSRFAHTGQHAEHFCSRTGNAHSGCAQDVAHHSNLYWGGPRVLPSCRRCECSQCGFWPRSRPFVRVLKGSVGRLHVSEKSQSSEHQLYVIFPFAPPVRKSDIDTLRGFLALVLSQVLCCRLVLNLMGAREDSGGYSSSHLGSGARTHPNSTAVTPIPLLNFRKTVTHWD